MRAYAEVRQFPAHLRVTKSCTILLAFVVLITALSVTTSAQRITGTLRGQVNDPNGAVVTSANVTATNEQTGVKEHTVSTSTGSFEFPTLLPGPYTVNVQVQGFRDSITKNVMVTANNVTDRIVTLSLGTASETVEVNAGVAEVQTT